MKGRDGFSTLEALVTVAVTATVLGLAVWAAGSARGIGFRLGNQATQATERAVAADVFDVTVGGLVWPCPSGTACLVGDAAGFRGDLIAERATPCAGAGPAADGGLRLERVGGRTQLLCRGPGAPVLLLDLGVGAAAFSYSADGRVWAASWNSAAAAGSRLLVRLSTASGDLDWTAAARRPASAPLGPP